MNKFLTLLIKEVRELVTPLTLIPLVLAIALFGGLGQILKNEQQKTKQPQPIAVVADPARYPVHQAVLGALQSHNFKVDRLSAALSDEQALSEAQARGDIALVVLPPLSADGLSGNVRHNMPFYSIVHGFSAAASTQQTAVQTAQALINDAASSALLASALPAVAPTAAKAPLVPQEHVVIGSRQAAVSLASVLSFVNNQVFFIPIILFMIIIFAAQMIATSIATEKENKTLETLLSLPISRQTIVTAKLLAAGLVALAYSAIYMLGFRSYLNGITGGNSAVPPAVSTAVSQLGLTFSTGDYLLLGLSLFLTILSVLAIALILGTFAEDVKSVQGVITPLTILILIPYFLTLFLDFSTISPLSRFLINAIPFSHPFLAPQYIWQHNYPPVLYGIAYLAVVFTFFVYLASRLFSSDRVLTLKIKFRKRSLLR